MFCAVTIAEHSLFIRHAEKLWSAEEREEFIDYIAFNPDAGTVIPQTRGLRKIRWQRQGSGKRGGVRVIYYYYNEQMPLYLVDIYAKAERIDLSPSQKKALTMMIDQFHKHAGEKK